MVAAMRGAGGQLQQQRWVADGISHLNVSLTWT